jgi:ADP-heptose:LPS heptosyltransferase
MPILFVTSTRIGDAILSTGLLRELLDRYPGEEIVIACGAPAAKVFENVPRLSRVHVMTKRRGGGHWLDLWRAMVGQRWRAVVDLRRSLLRFVLVADHRYGQPRPKAGEHRVETISRTLGLPPQAPKLWAGPIEEERAATLLGGRANLLAVAPGANWDRKMWPADRFAELCRRLTGKDGPVEGAAVLLVGAANEREAIRPVIEAMPADRVVDALGLDILSTYAALARCRLFVGNDSAMMHLAAATGRPTAGLFGPTRDDLYGPWGPNGLALRTPESFAELMEQVDRPDSVGSLLESLSVDAVEAAIRRRWTAAELAAPTAAPGIS